MLEMNSDDTDGAAPAEGQPGSFHWVLWPLWIVSIVGGGSLVSGILLLRLIGPASIPMGAVLGGVLGGSVIGFLPWLNQYWRGWRTGLRAFVLVASPLVPLAVWLVGAIVVNAGYILTFWILPGVLSALAISAVTRWTCRRWQDHQAQRWVWMLAGMLFVLITCVFCLIGAVTAAQ